AINYHSKKEERMKQKLVIILTTLCFLPLTIVAQELDRLVDKIDNTIKSNEREWKLLSKTFEGNSCIVKWAQPSGSNPPNPLKDEYLALVRAHPSEKEAAAELQGTFIRTSSGDRGEKVSGIGQEAYIFRNNPERSVWLRFRHHNIFVELRAPS